MKYAYFDSNSNESTFKILQNKSLAQEDAALGFTLSPIWDINNNTTYNFIAFNDQPPNATSSASYDIQRMC